MTKARLGYMWLMKAVSKTVRHGVVSKMCRLCLYNVVEDVEHFLVGCPVLEVCRRQLEYRMEQVLPCLGAAGAELLERFNDPRVGRLRVLLGDLEVECVEEEDPVDDRFVKAQAGKARWFVDKAVKNFLVSCWKAREAVLGRYEPRGGLLVHQPGRYSVLALRLCSDNSVDPVFTGEKVRRARIYWKSWVERAPFFDSSGGTGKKKGFFIAWVPDGSPILQVGGL